MRESDPVFCPNLLASDPPEGLSVLPGGTHSLCGVMIPDPEAILDEDVYVGLRGSGA